MPPGSVRPVLTGVEPPPHVCATFGLRDREPVPLGAEWEVGWRLGDVVLSPVVDAGRAAWSARVRETLVVEGVRLARPVRSTDGRYVVSGWRADTFVEGEPESRHDEVVSLSGRLHAATAQLDRPRFLAHAPAAPYQGGDLFLAADHSAWDAQPTRVLRAQIPEDPTQGALRSLELIGQLGTLRRQVSSPNQLVHGDLFGTVLFSGNLAPAITDITPYWRPAGWAAAVVVVDSLAWGGADDGLIGRWEDIPEWPQMLLRALMFRLAVHALHPRATEEAFLGLARTADMVRMIL